MKYRISLAQLNIQPGQVKSNLDQALAMLNAAHTNDSQLLLLPELWSSGYDLENAAKHALATPEILDELARQAATLQIHIGGSLLESRPEGLYNTFTWIAPNGARAVYRKIHLFRLMSEDQWLHGGDHLEQAQAPWGPTGLAICYDLRFPELFRRYALDGISAFALSAEWPAKRAMHWQTLLRARAIENQAYLFATNCVGLSGAETFGGHSVILTPWGEALAEGNPTDPELVSAEIETDLVDQARKFMPVFQDRRPDLYRLS
jgi:omega-amidase